MKKITLKLLPVFLLTVMGITFSACEKKEKSSNETANEASAIVGQWRHDFSVGFIMRTFKKDGSGITQEYDSEQGGIEYTEYFTYYYDENAEQYKIVEKDGSYTYILTVMYVNKSEMVIIDPDGNAEQYYRVN